jgi:hypothetical protein
MLPALTSRATAVEQGPYAMEILIDGRPIAEYAARGRTYVEALAGREYSVRLVNRTGSRIAIALSVDGLNSIDAESTSARDAAKWILGPYEEIVIDGWQTSSANARRFYFTSETASYGAWLGKTDDLGVIAAAVFRERVPPPSRIGRPLGKLQGRSDSPAAPKPSPPAEMRREAGSEASAAPELSDEMAATGIGREVEHPVQRVRFDAEPAAAALLEMRYEYRDALVRLGVLPTPCDPASDRLARREQSRGFREPGFAPDPFRRDGCR